MLPKNLLILENAAFSLRGSYLIYFQDIGYGALAVFLPGVETARS